MFTDIIRHIRPLCVILLAFTVASCGGSSGDDPVPNPPTVSRTVIVYMAANNNLTSGSGHGYFLNKQQMLSAAAEGGLNGGRLIVIEKRALGAPVKMVEITPGGEKELRVYSDATSSVSADVIKKCVADARRIAPADEYALIMWSHGTGWISHLYPQSRAWGQDDDFRRTPEADIAIPDLAAALQGNRFRFVYFDCCYMGNVETLYELKKADVTDCVIASPTETPFDGMPYDLNIPEFFRNSPDLKKVVKNTVDRERYRIQTSFDAQCGISLSLYDLAALPALSDICARIERTPADVVIARGDFKEYGFTNTYKGLFYDLLDYYTTIASSSSDLDELNSAFAKVVTYNDRTDMMWNFYPLEGTSGLSANVYQLDPSRSQMYGYDGLRWWVDVVKPAL